MKDALMDTLRVWEIPPGRIIGMSWDTTSSNTGKHGGSATLFEQELQRSILWLACRHHVGELHVKHADVATRGTWKGTDLYEIMNGTPTNTDLYNSCMHIHHTVI